MDIKTYYMQKLAHLESPESVWVASISLKNVLMNMTYPSGYPTPVWQPNAREGMPDTLLGRPLIWTEKVPLAGNAGDLGLYNFRHYLLGDRQAITIASTQDESVNSPPFRMALSNPNARSPFPPGTGIQPVGRMDIQLVSSRENVIGAASFSLAGPSLTCTWMV